MKEHLKLIIKHWPEAFRLFKKDLKEALFFLKYRLGLAKEGKDFHTCGLNESEFTEDEEFFY